MATLSEKPANKYQGLIRERLQHTLRRIRFVDLTAGLLGLLALVLGYLAVMIGLDVLFRLADGTRQVFTWFFFVGAGAYCWYFVVRPLCREINPHYAARRLEQSAGEGRHQVVNWIDLENETLPAVYRASLDRRAARELEQADPEQAISPRPLYGTAAVTLALFVVVVVLFIALGPKPFGAYFGRAFGHTAAIPPRTHIELVRPEGGDSTVTIGNPVAFVVRITGYRPQANSPESPTLHWWNEAAATPRTRALTLSGSDEWSTTLGPLEVGNGFWYHLTAGDARTPDYRVRVRASAHLSDFRAVYRYRPYLNLPEKIRTVRAIEEVRGTEVILEGKPNREVREATLEFTDEAGKVRLQSGAIVPSPEGVLLRWRLVLDRPGGYRLSYVATTGEAYRDATTYPIAILPDSAPRITFTEPAKDVSLPVNGSLRLKADIRDDVGIAAVTLKIKRIDGPEWPERPYWAGKLGSAEIGTPRELAYQEVLVPLQVDESLQPGTVLEYWLEARDNCDFPQANLGVSDRFRVTLTPPGDASAEQHKRQQQQKEKQAHDQQQENGLKQQKAQRDEQNRQDRSGASGSGNQANQESDPKQGDPKERDPKERDPEQADPKEEDLETQADKLRQALNNKDRKKDRKEGKKPDEGNQDGNADKPGEGKPAETDTTPPPKAGQGKEDQQEKPGEAKGGQGERPGESKGGQKAQNGAEGKDQGQDDGQEGKGTPKPGDPGQGDKPGAGKQQPENTTKSASKGPGNREGSPRPDDRPGQSKPGEAQPGQDSPGAGKEGQPNHAARPDDKAGQAKPGAPSQPDTSNDPKAEGKPGGPPEGSNPPKPAKGPPPPDAQPAEGKPGDNAPMNPADKAGTTKPQPGQNVGKQAPPTEDKGNSKGDTAPPTGQAGQGKDGPPPAGIGEMGKPPATPPLAGMPPPGADKPHKPDSTAAAPSEDGNKPGEAKAAGGSGQGKGEAPEARPAKRERPRGSRATQLQLEEFRKAVGEEVLKDAQMSREQFERFLKDYAALADRRRQQEAERDNIRPGHPSSLPSSGGITPTTPTGRDNLSGGSRPKPPSEYRDAYADFLRRLR
ncbi:MAG: hypothetical protein SNJ75_15840 [Gemmataceae bacterium]